MDILTTRDCDQWDEILEETFQYDFYHTQAYHKIAEDRGEGEAHLFVYREAGYTIATPLLLRPLREISGLNVECQNWLDATSVYGYAGPVASHPEMPGPVVKNFQAAFCESMRQKSVISVFSRLHPLIRQSHLLQGLGESAPTGKTVSIDLTLPPQEQARRIRKTHARQIRRLRERNLVFVEDIEGKDLHEFADIYTDTMRRVDAVEYYHFNKSYFEALQERMGPRLHLFFIFSDGQPVCGALFVLCDGILQWHLGGTRDEHLHYAPNKLLVDCVRLWAGERGIKVMHLGGGVGGKEDSLFEFKVGFTDRKHDFSTWSWVSDPEAYAIACESKATWNRCHGLAPVDNSFFPPYRVPVQPI